MLSVSVVLLYVGVSLVWTRELPASFKRCKVSTELDSKQNECLRDAVYDAIVQLASGNEQLGVDTLDPLKVKQIKIEQGESSPVAVKLTFKDVNIRGIKDLELDSITGKMSSPETFVLKGVGYTPQLSLVGLYTITGRVLVLPIQGHGHSNLTLDNVKATFTMKGEAQTKNGERYLKINDVRLNIKSTSRLWIYLENLFNGDKALADNMNVFLNNNWQDIFTELRPNINSAFSGVLKDYVKQIMESVPFDKIFITSQ